MFDRSFERGHQTTNQPNTQDVRMESGHDADKRAPRNGVRALITLVEELLEEIRFARVSNTAKSAHMRGQIINGVIDSGTDVFDSTGALTKSYGVIVGSLSILNNTGATVTIQAAPQGGTSAPIRGRGVYIIPAGAFFSVPVGVHGWTAYGTAGTSLVYTAFTGLQAFGVVG